MTLARLIIVALTLLPLLLSPARPGESQATCTHYVANNGSGNGLSQGSPFTMAAFWSVAGPGSVACLADGTYQGSANMIDPPDNKAGTASAPITVRALNEGAVLIDGQFQRQPVNFSFNHWITVEGINIKSSSGSLFVVNNDSSHITGRRIVAWDANGTQETFAFGAINGSDFTTFEDIAAFGMFCRGLHHHGGSSNTVTVRRAWIDHQGYVATGDCDIVSYHLNYASSPHMTCENCLGSQSFHQQPFSYTYAAMGTIPSGSATGYRFATVGSGPPKIVRIRGGAGTNVFVDTFLTGSLFYARPTDRWRFNGVQVGPVDAIISPGANRTPINGVTIRDTFVFISPSNPGFGFVRGFAFPINSETSDAADLYLINTSTVRGLATDFRTNATSGGAVSDWQVTNHFQATTLGAVPSPWTTTTGARVCERWVNRAKTNQPLWPWPMNERIKAATAASGRYTGPCGINAGDCRWGDSGQLTQAPLRTEIDVTAEIEALLGPIPAECRSEGGTTPPPGGGGGGGAPPGTIAHTHLQASNDVADLSSYTTGSVTLPANNLNLLTAIGAAATANGSPPPTVVGPGSTVWEHIATATIGTGSGERTASMFRSMVSAQASGTVTIDYGSGITQARLSWIIDTFSGVDTSGAFGSGAIVQSATAATNATTNTPTLASALGTGNRPYATYRIGGTRTATPDTGWTEIVEQSTSEGSTSYAQWKDASDDQSATVTQSGPASEMVGVVVEIKASAEAGPTDVTYVGEGVWAAHDTVATLTPGLPPNLAQNHMMYVGVASMANGTPTWTVTSPATTGNGGVWTKLGTANREIGANDLTCEVWRKVAGVQEFAPSVTVSDPTGGHSAVVWALQGVDLTTPDDVTATTATAAAASTWVPPSITPVTSHARVMTFACTQALTQLAVQTAQGFTERLGGANWDTGVGIDHAIGLADTIHDQESPTAVVMPTWGQTANAPQAWAGVTVAARLSGAPVLPGPPPQGGGTPTIPRLIISELLRPLVPSALRPLVPAALRPLVTP